MDDDLPSRSASPHSQSSNMARRWARRVERYCCSCLTYFPLAFVYGLTTWAVWVIVSIGSAKTKVDWIGMRHGPLSLSAATLNTD